MFRLQFDEFQIVSSSHDDTILIWDFLEPQTECRLVGGGHEQVAAAPAALNAENAQQAPNIARPDGPENPEISDNGEFKHLFWHISILIKIISVG